MQTPLKGRKLVTLALNVPGPVAAARLAGLGAECVKVEPPAGDPLMRAARPWYETLVKGQTVVTLDLKNAEGREKLDDLLREAHLLLTSFRLSALARLGLDWESVHARHPRLCVINMIGYPAPHEDIPGHDLTYQARLGMLRPPQLPVTLYADLAGAERAVNVALALLLNMTRGAQAECVQVSLFEALRDFTGPLTAGLTTPGGSLGGGFPFYGLYQASDGWIAVAALEPGFIQRLSQELKLKANSREEMECIFKTRTAEEWEEWASKKDLPIAKVHI